ncbi:putative RNA methyltransferase [Specibacter sp. NPDC057265]|uniref:putative RNA methyltransferase n=1 Tax=Specibacter sp. NPDC057265 TaxID=3346075 RepID=UPI0036327A14
MNNRAFNALLCPHCGLGFTPAAAHPPNITCAQGHSFDVARQGYVNLLTGSGTKFASDTTAMVAAREAFLDAGHYLPLAQALTTQVQQLLGAATEQNPALVVDAGTGTGWYLQQVCAALAVPVAAVGLDISKYALRRAARRNPQAVSVVWDLWQPLPVHTGVADLVLVVFAPRNAAEFARILKPEGALVVITPTAAHLASMAREMGMLGIQEGKEEALIQALAQHFAPAGSTELEVPLELSPADVGNVALMGPAGHHLDAAALKARLPQLPPVTKATAGFRISVFRPAAAH